MAQKKTAKRNRTVMFIICSPELKKRAQRAAKHTFRDLSRYVAFALEEQLENDEADMRRRGLL